MVSLLLIQRRYRTRTPLYRPLPPPNPSFCLDFRRASPSRSSRFTPPPPLASPTAARMPFKRFVEIGRVALVNYGKDYGRLVVIVDVVDQNRALVDAPDMVRCQINFKRLSLTDIKIDIKRVPKKTTLIKAMEEADVKTKWENSSWGKKLIVQKRRAALNDFDRFKVMLAKIKRGGAIRQELAKLKKASTA
ncbi:large ribosomal subunit protein eL14-like [Miscanthus floridulus]|uniref:large ribosomal subunit protein eL14-like n=1 Tax=Miscanthus floridulus TaxID=154761 RepID=UPI003458AE57